MKIKKNKIVHHRFTSLTGYIEGTCYVCEETSNKGTLKFLNLFESIRFGSVLLFKGYCTNSSKFDKRIAQKLNHLGFTVLALNAKNECSDHAGTVAEGTRKIFLIKN